MTDKTRSDQTERNNLRASVLHITTGGKEEEQQEDVPAFLLFPVAGCGRAGPLRYLGRGTVSGTVPKSNCHRLTVASRRLMMLVYIHSRVFYSTTSQLDSILGYLDILTATIPL